MLNIMCLVNYTESLLMIAHPQSRALVNCFPIHPVYEAEPVSVLSNRQLIQRHIELVDDFNSWVRRFRDEDQCEAHKDLYREAPYCLPDKIIQMVKEVT